MASVVAEFLGDTPDWRRGDEPPHNVSVLKRGELGAVVVVVVVPNKGPAPFQVLRGDVWRWCRGDPCDRATCETTGAAKGSVTAACPFNAAAAQGARCGVEEVRDISVADDAVGDIGGDLLRAGERATGVRDTGVVGIATPDAMLVETVRY